MILAHENSEVTPGMLPRVISSLTTVSSQILHLPFFFPLLFAEALTGNSIQFSSASSGPQPESASVLKGNSANTQVSVQGPRQTRPLGLNPGHVHPLAPSQPPACHSETATISSLWNRVIDDTQEFHSGLPRVLEVAMATR